MKLGKLIDERLQLTLAKLSTEPLPIKTAFKLKGIIKVAREEFSKYEEVRKDALQRHGKKNDDGTLKVNDTNNVEFEEAGIKAFVAELNELLALEVELPAISLAELGDKVVLSVEELESLDGLLVQT